MCWRVVSKIQKTVCVVIFYYIVYSLLSFAFTPDPPATFVREELRIVDKYALMFLVAPSAKVPVFTDAEGANVLAVRRCGNCFITNNQGFLPITEYDGVLIYGNKNVLSEAAMEPGKRYLLQSTSKCISDKFRGCSTEPEITSFATQKTYTLCSLCDHLINKKDKRERCLTGTC